MHRSSFSIARLSAAGISALALGGCFNFLFPTAPDQFVETVLRAQCQFQFRCCTPSERNNSSRDEATCVENALESGGASIIGDRAKSAVDRGAATYDNELADRCVRTITDAANACEPDAFFNGNDPECSNGFARGFTVGTVDDGDDCVDSFDCADEGDCIVEEDPTVVTVAGECRGRAGEGESCAEKACQAGLACDFSGDDPECKKVELLDDGEECFVNEECDSRSCVQSEVRTCFDTGEPCDEDSDCDEDNFDFCDFDVRAVCGPPADIEICDGQ
jgi:hypothetical protein